MPVTARVPFHCYRSIKFLVDSHSLCRSNFFIVSLHYMHSKSEVWRCLLCTRAAFFDFFFTYCPAKKVKIFRAPANNQDKSKKHCKEFLINVIFALLFFCYNIPDIRDCSVVSKSRSVVWILIRYLHLVFITDDMAEKNFSHK